jgi:endonuclease-8
LFGNEYSGRKVDQAVVEGPSIVILCEEAREFVGKRVLECATSLAHLAAEDFRGKTLTGLSFWGKHFLMTFKAATFKIHFLMFGSYRINAPKPDKGAKLSLVFRVGRMDFYSCSIQRLAAPAETIYDWRVDIMSPQWDEDFVLRRLSKQPDVMVCDALLDQSLFSGSGNIIKNEVLLSRALLPRRLVGSLTARERRSLVRETHRYGGQFYEWKKASALKRHWRVFRRRECGICGGPVEMQKTGLLNRVRFFCSICQK